MEPETAETLYSSAGFPWYMSIGALLLTGLVLGYRAFTSSGRKTDVSDTVGIGELQGPRNTRLITIAQVY